MVSLGSVLGNTGQGHNPAYARISLPSGWRWQTPSRRSFRCEIRLCPESEGGFSVYSPELPGVISEGDNAAEATKNMAEALQGAISTYLHDCGGIPWKRNIDPVSESEARLWIVVNV